MIDAICGGIVVGLGAIADLVIGGPVGAFMFGLTVLSAIYFRLDLFIGRPGLLTDKNLDIVEMIFCLIGNFIGVTWIAVFVKMVPGYGSEVDIMAKQLLSSISWAHLDTLLITSFFAGLTMYGGVIAYDMTKNWLMLVLPITMCILAGWPICFRTFFILWAGDFENWKVIIPVIMGNTLGVNTWHMLRRHSPRYMERFKRDSSDIASKFHEYVLSTKNQSNTDNPSDK